MRTESTAEDQQGDEDQSVESGGESSHAEVPVHVKRGEPRELEGGSRGSKMRAGNPGLWSAEVG